MLILLTCCMGMSTSLLVESMHQAAKKHHQEHQIWCIDQEQVEKEVQHCDVLLLGPQIRHTYKRLYKAYASFVPVIMIDAQAYGRLDGEMVLNQAMEAIRQYKENGNYLDFNEEEWKV